MFRIGDYVAHYKEGVCEVVNIGKIDMGSSDKEYYTLKPVYDAAGTVYTPVDNKREQIRQLITKEEAQMSSVSEQIEKSYPSKIAFFKAYLNKDNLTNDEIKGLFQVIDDLKK